MSAADGGNPGEFRARTPGPGRPAAAVSETAQKRATQQEADHSAGATAAPRERRALAFQWTVAAPCAWKGSNGYSSRPDL